MNRGRFFAMNPGFSSESDGGGRCHGPSARLATARRVRRRGLQGAGDSPPRPPQVLHAWPRGGRGAQAHAAKAVAQPGGTRVVPWTGYGPVPLPLPIRLGRGGGAGPGPRASSPGPPGGSGGALRGRTLRVHTSCGGEKKTLEPQLPSFLPRRVSSSFGRRRCNKLLTLPLAYKLKLSFGYTSKRFHQ